jgi:hypothetical protein
MDGPHHSNEASLQKPIYVPRCDKPASNYRYEIMSSVGEKDSADTYPGVYVIGSMSGLQYLCSISSVPRGLGVFFSLYPLTCLSPTTPQENVPRTKRKGGHDRLHKQKIDKRRSL